MKKVKDYPKYSITPNGDIVGPKGNLKPSITHDGYAYVTLYNASGRKKYKVHRLVADAFVPNPNNLPVVNHKDGNKLNNHPSNLEHTTVQGNTQHSFDNGLQEPLRGSTNGNAQLTEPDVLAIRASTDTAPVLAERYGVSKSLIYQIRSRKRWAHI